MIYIRPDNCDALVIYINLLWSHKKLMHTFPFPAALCQPDLLPVSRIPSCRNTHPFLLYFCAVTLTHSPWYVTSSTFSPAAFTASTTVSSLSSIMPDVI